MPELTAHLPLHRAEVTPAPKAAPLPGSACYHCRYSQRRAGDGQYADEAWNHALFKPVAGASAWMSKDPITGKPPSLRYQIQNNKGIARVVHGDNVVCRAEIFSGLHQTGELMIKSRGNARCTGRFTLSDAGNYL
ncbi:ssrAB activated gene [Salmonella enterica subsp. enterica]|nr:ssrAB activated gene [Salmonella enterica subsp. enterica]